MTPDEPVQFRIESKRGASVWTDGTPVFEFNGHGKNTALWVGIDEHGPAWFWMTAARTRHLVRFLAEHVGMEVIDHG